MPDDMVIVRMVSEEFGVEQFEYDTTASALAGIKRLVAEAEAQGDGVERLIGIVVNPETDDDDEDDFDAMTDLGGDGTS